MDMNYMKKVSIVDLQRDLKDQQEENKDMFKSISLNQQAQELAMFKNNQYKTIPDDSKETLVKSLYLENQQLRNLIEKMTNDRNAAQSKAILIEQQSEESMNFKKMMRQELDERIKEIRKNLYDKEVVIQQIEIDKTNEKGQKDDPDANDNQNLLIHKDAQFIKHIKIEIQVLTASVTLFKIHEETEQLKKEITNSVQQIEEMNQKNKKCKDSTKVIKFQIEQLKDGLTKSSYKKKNCITEQYNIFSDEEDQNVYHLQQKVPCFHKEKIRMDIFEEKQNNPNKVKGKNGYQASGQTTQRSQKMSQQINLIMETDIEKYKSLSQIWLDKNKKKVNQIKKLQRYNVSLEKSNVQLIENYNNLQSKIQQMNQNLKQFKESYSQLMNRKKMRNHSLNMSSFLNNSLTNVSTQSNQNTVGNNESLFSPKNTKQVGFEDIINKKVDEKDLLSVEEEEMDEDISQRRTLSQYQTIAQKSNELQKKESSSSHGDFHYDDYFDKKPYPALQRKKQCIPYLFKLKQQIDKLKNIPNFSMAILKSNPYYINTDALPQPQFRIQRSLSDCTDATPSREKYVTWSIQKRQLSHFIQQNPLLLQAEDSVDEDGDQYNSMNKNEEKTKRKLNDNPQGHNNSFFRELDISVILPDKKNKK